MVTLLVVNSILSLIAFILVAGKAEGDTVANLVIICMLCAIIFPAAVAATLVVEDSRLERVIR